MAQQTYMIFTASNRRIIFLLVGGYLFWSGGLFCLWLTGRLIETALFWWSAGFICLQLFIAAQLLLPILLFQPQERTRGFYLFWGVFLGLLVWLINQFTPVGLWQPLVDTLKSGLLLLVATLTGAVLARYVTKLWEVLPICLVMTLADFASLLIGPTAQFAETIREHYLAPDGTPPLIDMVLVKLAFPGPPGLAPVFGLSDWIMVVFFVSVAQRFGINDNLIGAAGEKLAQQGRFGRYLPVSVVALLVAVLLAQSTGLFIPALPVIALIVLLWYAARSLHFCKNRRCR